MKLNKKFKYLITISIVIAILFIAYSISWNITSEKELKITAFNMSAEKKEIGFFIFQGTEENNTFTAYYETLEHNESCMFHIKIDKSYTIFKVFIHVLNYTCWINPSECNGKKLIVDAHASYSFPNGEVHDLLAVVDISGDILTITKMPEPKYIAKVDFP